MKYVVGWSLSPVNDQHLTLAALKRALLHRCPGAELLHHFHFFHAAPNRTGETWSGANGR